MRPKSKYLAEYRRALLVQEAGGECFECGYDKSLQALQFHHIDPETKLFPLKTSECGRSMDSLRKEAEKCVLLCANCHTEEHNGEKLQRVPE